MDKQLLTNLIEDTEKRRDSLACNSEYRKAILETLSEQIYQFNELSKGELKELCVIEIQRVAQRMDVLSSAYSKYEEQDFKDLGQIERNNMTIKRELEGGNK